MPGMWESEKDRHRQDNDTYPDYPGGPWPDNQDPTLADGNV